MVVTEVFWTHGSSHTKRSQPWLAGLLLQNNHCFEKCLSVFYLFLTHFFTELCPRFTTSCFMHHVHSPFRPCCVSAPLPAHALLHKGKEANPGSEAHTLSQLSSFSLLSANISSNTLLGWRYGHQRAGWYVWPLWNYSAPCLLNLCLWSYRTCQHMCKWSFPIARSS